MLREWRRIACPYCPSSAVCLAGIVASYMAGDSIEVRVNRRKVSFTCLCHALNRARKTPLAVTFSVLRGRFTGKEGDMLDVLEQAQRSEDRRVRRANRKKRGRRVK